VNSNSDSRHTRAYLQTINIAGKMWNSMDRILTQGKVEIIDMVDK